MSQIKDSTGGGAVKPPSVAQELWDAVPERRRPEFLEHAAEGIRRGHHPDDTFERLIEEHGFQMPAKPSAPPPSARGLGRRPPAPPALAPRPPAAKVPVPPRAGQSDPLAAVFEQAGLGRAAVDGVMAAVAGDPVMAFSDPLGLPALAGAKAGLTDALETQVRAMAEARIEALRALPHGKRGGWIDPDDWATTAEGDGPGFGR